MHEITKIIHYVQNTAMQTATYRRPFHHSHQGVPITVFQNCWNKGIMPIIIKTENITFNNSAVVE